MKKWEYDTEVWNVKDYENVDFTDRFNELGKKGWELVTVLISPYTTPDGSVQIIAVFKRINANGTIVKALSR